MYDMCLLHEENAFDRFESNRHNYRPIAGWPSERCHAVMTYIMVAVWLYLIN